MTDKKNQKTETDEEEQQEEKEGLWPGGTHLEKEYGDVRPLRPLFKLSQQFLKTLISACFSSLSPPFQQNHKFHKICRSRAYIYAKFLFQSRKFCQNSVFKPYFFKKSIL